LEILKYSITGGDERLGNWVGDVLNLKYFVCGSYKI